MLLSAGLSEGLEVLALLIADYAAIVFEDVRFAKPCLLILGDFLLNCLIQTPLMEHMVIMTLFGAVKDDQIPALTARLSIDISFHRVGDSEAGITDVHLADIAPGIPKVQTI